MGNGSENEAVIERQKSVNSEIKVDKIEQGNIDNRSVEKMAQPQNASEALNQRLKVNQTEVTDNEKKNLFEKLEEFDKVFSELSQNTKTIEKSSGDEDDNAHARQLNRRNELVSRMQNQIKSVKGNLKLDAEASGWVNARQLLHEAETLKDNIEVEDYKLEPWTMLGQHEKAVDSLMDSIAGDSFFTDSKYYSAVCDAIEKYKKDRSEYNRDELRLTIQEYIETRSKKGTKTEFFTSKGERRMNWMRNIKRELDKVKELEERRKMELAEPEQVREAVQEENLEHGAVYEHEAVHEEKPEQVYGAVPEEKEERGDAQVPEEKNEQEAVKAQEKAEQEKKEQDKAKVQEEKKKQAQKAVQEKKEQVQTKKSESKEKKKPEKESVRDIAKELERKLTSDNAKNVSVEKSSVKKEVSNVHNSSEELKEQRVSSVEQESFSVDEEYMTEEMKRLDRIIDSYVEKLKDIDVQISNADNFVHKKAFSEAGILLYESSFRLYNAQLAYLTAMRRELQEEHDAYLNVLKTIVSDGYDIKNYDFEREYLSSLGTDNIDEVKVQVNDNADKYNEAMNAYDEAKQAYDSWLAESNEKVHDKALQVAGMSAFMDKVENEYGTTTADILIESWSSKTKDDIEDILEAVKKLDMLDTTKAIDDEEFLDYIEKHENDINEAVYYLSTLYEAMKADLQNEEA